MGELGWVYEVVGAVFRGFAACCHSGEFNAWSGS